MGWYFINLYLWLCLNWANHAFINNWASQSLDWDILYSFIIRIQQYIVLIMCYYYSYTWFHSYIDFFYEYILIYVHYALFNYFHIFWYMYVWYIMCILYEFIIGLALETCQEWTFGKENVILLGYVFMLVKKGIVMCIVMFDNACRMLLSFFGICIPMYFYGFQSMLTAMHSYYYVQWTYIYTLNIFTLYDVVVLMR